MSKDLELPRSIDWPELDHESRLEQCFGPDYNEEDIGKDFDLTVTLFGYQLGEEEVKKLVDELKKHLFVCSVHKFTRKENGNGK